MNTSGLYTDWMLACPPDEISPLPHVPPSQLPLPHWFDQSKWPHLAAPELINAIYRCQRCGMCRQTSACAVIRKNPPLEVYTPRSIIALARALLEERLRPQALPSWFAKALADCNCCGRCGDLCIVNVAYREGASPEPNIDHGRLFAALKKTFLQ
ncbi:MAG: hypothetical protein M1389_07575 [Chloroflexi bacterium]|nr:hypothetical protein [Chloroflexota bacterium]